MSDNTRTKGRCCDCRWLGLNANGSGTCEGTIPSVYQSHLLVSDGHLNVSEVMVVRACDCYEPRIKPLEEDNG